MAILKNITARSGTYKDKQGNEKSSYVRCGVILETKNGEAIKLEALPVNFDGWLYMHDPEPREARPDAKKDPARHFDDLKDEPIPF